jgi:hypothetical protein
MRNVLLALSLAVFAVSTGANAQDNKDHKDHSNKPRIEGSGNMITKEVAVKSFDELNVQGVFSVLLTQGTKEEVKIEADDNLQELFEVKNEGSKLSINTKKDVNYSSKKKLKVYITLKSMELKTVGDISSDANLNFDDLKISNKSVGSIDLKMTAQNLNVENKSVGNVKLNGKAENAIIKNKGVGSVQAASFIVQKMDIENDGVGSAEVNAAKELKVKDSFLGKVTNKGAAPVKRLKKVEI